MQNPNSAARGEGERLLAVAEKLLQSRNLVDARDFAILAQENEPLLEGSDQILAISEVLISSEKRINQKHHDWYAILQIDRRSDDLDLIKKQYRRLALLLHPDKNRFPFADHAFQLVADAWSTLSDSVKKSQFDRMMTPFTRVDLVSGGTQSHFSPPVPPPSQGGIHANFTTPQMQNHTQNQGKFPVRGGESDARSSKQNGSGTGGNGNVSLSFWTACPYCYVLCEYPRAYEGCGLRCQRCERAFHGSEIPALPPLVPGKDAYHCCWASFPIGFKEGGTRNGEKGFPNWMPPMFDNNASKTNNITKPAQQSSQPPIHKPQSQPQTQPQQATPMRMGVDMSFGVRSADDGTKKKRGRPRKYPL